MVFTTILHVKVQQSDPQIRAPQMTSGLSRRSTAVSEVVGNGYSPTRTPLVSSEHCQSQSSRTGTPQTR